MTPRQQFDQDYKRIIAELRLLNRKMRWVDKNKHGIMRYLCVAKLCVDVAFVRLDWWVARKRFERLSK